MAGEARVGDMLVRYVPRALAYVWPYRGLAAASVAVTTLSALVGLLGPWPLKLLIDNVLGTHPWPGLLAGLPGTLGEDRVLLLLAVAAAGLGLTLIGNGLGVLESYVLTKLEQRMVLDFRSDLFQHVQRLSLAFHDRQRIGDLMTRMTSQTQAVGSVVTRTLSLTQNAVTLLGMFWIAYRVDRPLALLSLTVVPLIYYSIGYYAARIQPKVRRVKDMEAESLSILHETMTMFRVILAFGREPHEYRRFREQGESALAARVRLTVGQTLFSLTVNIAAAAGTALVVGVGAYHVLLGQLTVGQLLVVMTYIVSVYAPIQAISGTIGVLPEQLVNLQMAFELLDTEPEIRDRPGAIGVARAAGRLVFEGVHFSYEGRVDTLKDVSFEAPAGRVVALVGPTGAGKTTLVNLIPRFYDPQRGRILLDGTDIRALTLRSLREQVSLVPQEPLLFSGTVADNVRYGRLDADMSDIVAAAKAANAHDFIISLPDQYRTRLGERGAQLSGGERQRLCVARAFLKGASILILDEPTASVDSRTEAVILEALERLMVGRTTFLIAHRLSTIRNADLVLTLQQGQVAEQGTPEALWRGGGLYRQLYEAQSREAARKSRSATSGVTVAPAATQT